MKKLIILFFGIVLLSFCAVRQKSVGEKLYLNKCGACHIRPQPGKFPYERIKKIIGGHWKPINLKPEEIEQVARFLSQENQNF